MPTAAAISRVAGGVEALAVKQLCRGVDQLLAAITVVAFVHGLAGAPAGAARRGQLRRPGNNTVHGFEP